MLFFFFLFLFQDGKRIQAKEKFCEWEKIENPSLPCRCKRLTLVLRNSLLENFHMEANVCLFMLKYRPGCLCPFVTNFDHICNVIRAFFWIFYWLYAVSKVQEDGLLLLMLLIHVQHSWLCILIPYECNVCFSFVQLHFFTWNILNLFRNSAFSVFW